MEYFKTDKEAVNEFVNFYKKMAEDLIDFTSKFSKDQLHKIASNEDVISFKDHEKKKMWLNDVEDLINNLTILRRGHLFQYNELIEKSKRLQSIETKIKTDDKYVTVLGKMRLAVKRLNTVASELINESADFEFPVEQILIKKLRCIETLTINDYKTSDFKFEHLDRYGIPLTLG